MKKIMNKLVVMLAVLFVFGLCGCDNSETKDTTEKVSQGTDENESGESVYPVEITDSTGETITISKEPEKIVSVAPNLTEIVCELGASDKLVGRSDYCDYPATVTEIESVGTIQTPDIEKIISLDPDIVLTSIHFDDATASRLKEFDITVITLSEDRDIAGVYTMIETLGKALNCTSEAKTCVDDMKATIEEVEAAVKDLEKPTVYYVIGYGEYGDFTAGGDTFVGAMLEMAGGDNIAKDVSGWSFTLEELIEKDPSIIIIAEFMKEDFLNSPNYSELTAVKEGNVYTLDTNMLDRQSYRNGQGVKELAKIFHPEAFK